MEAGEATRWMEISIICPVPKKGALLESENCRGMSLLNTAYKGLSNIINAH
jgi:hypothetical protein